MSITMCNEADIEDYEYVTELAYRVWSKDDDEFGPECPSDPLEAMADITAFLAEYVISEEYLSAAEEVDALARRKESQGWMTCSRSHPYAVVTSATRALGLTQRAAAAQAEVSLS